MTTTATKKDRNVSTCCSARMVALASLTTLATAIATPTVTFAADPAPPVDGERATPQQSLRASRDAAAIAAAALAAEQRALPVAEKARPAAPVQAAPVPETALTEARLGSHLPEEVKAGRAIGWNGQPVKSRRAVYLRPHTVAEGETVRSIAYRFSTSPRALAGLNGIRWDKKGTELPAGEVLQVPIRFRSASGFSVAERLESNGGVRVDRPHHSWGRPYMIRLLADTFGAMHRRWPERHPLIVHDISRFGGGRIGRHKSHRAGRDIDIGYPTRQAEREGWGVPRLDDIDYERLWFVVERFERSGLTAAIYMSPRIQRRLHAYAVTQGVAAERLQLLFQYPAAKGQKTTLIRHSPGHRDHLHVRFCSPDEMDELQS